MGALIGCLAASTSPGGRRRREVSGGVVLLALRSMQHCWRRCCVRSGVLTVIAELCLPFTVPFFDASSTGRPRPQERFKPFQARFPHFEVQAPAKQSHLSLLGCKGAGESVDFGMSSRCDSFTNFPHLRWSFQSSGPFPTRIFGVSQIVLLSLAAEGLISP